MRVSKLRKLIILTISLIIIVLLIKTNPSISDYIQHWEENNRDLEVHTVHSKNYLVFSIYQMLGYDDLRPITIGLFGKLIDTEIYY